MAMSRESSKRDPYTEGPKAHLTGFGITGSYVAQTNSGYMVNYDLTCTFRKTNPVEFKRVRMLEKKSQLEFLGLVNRKTIVPALQRNEGAIRLLPELGGGPCLCRIIEEDGIRYVSADLNCSDLNRELESSTISSHGCTLDRIYFKFPDEISPECIDLNYDHMNKLYAEKSLENSAEFIAHRDAALMFVAKQKLELRRKFSPAEIDETHKANSFDVSIRGVGKAAKLAWRFFRSITDDETIRIFHSTGEDVRRGQDWACLAESKHDGSIVLRFDPGSKHSFRVQLKDDSSQSGADTQDTDEEISFTYHVPTKEEIADYDALLSSIFKQEPTATKDAGELKIEKVLSELRTFVEFEASITQFEKQFTAQILANPEYSEEEKEQKIERLKLMIEQLAIS